MPGEHESQCSSSDLCAIDSNFYRSGTENRKEITEQILEYLYRTWRFLSGNLQGLTTLKIYQADQQKADEMDVESQNFRRITMKVLTMQLNSTSVMDIVAYGGAVVGMAVTLSEFLKGNISISGTICIVLLASEFFLPLRLLGSFFHIAMNGMAASDKIFKILDLPEPQTGDKNLPDDSLDISFKNVHFAYEENREILKGIDLYLPAGNFVSLVGESGCGKSTIAGIILQRTEDLPERLPLAEYRFLR